MDIPSWAFRGAKVICVDAGDRLGPGRRPVSLDITEGLEYTIETVETEWVLPSRGVAEYGFMVHLVGIRAGDMIRSPFWGDRFRPVKTIETDMKEHFDIFLKVGERV